MPIAPLVGSALISGASSLLGGIFGGASNRSANREANATNLAIARETNQNQYQMFQEQNAFNERMYNQMQQYNTPAAQMQRYQEAGINPYIAAGNVQTGNAQSSLQSAQAPQLQMPQVAPALGMGDAIQNSFSQIGNVLSQYAQNELALSQAQKNRSESRWIDQLNAAKLSQMSAQTNNLQQQGSLLGLDFKMKSETLGNFIKLSDLSVVNAEKTNEQLEVITQSARFENALKNINLGIQSKHGEDMFVAQLSKTLAESFATQAGVRQRDAQISIDRQNADTNAKNAQTNAAVGAAQIQNLVANAIKATEEATGVKIDNETSRKIQNFVVDTYHSDAKTASNNAKLSYHNARIAGNEDDYWGANRAVNGFGQITGALGTGLGVFLGYKAIGGKAGLKKMFSKAPKIGFK